MKHILLILLASLFLPACAPALTPVPATATPTLTLEPTRTPTPAPTATITPTPTPEYPADFPPEFQAIVGDKQVDQVDTDQDGKVDKITDSASGETLFQLDAQGEWLRMIAFTLENGDKMEMARFDAPELNRLIGRRRLLGSLGIGVVYRQMWGGLAIRPTPNTRYAGLSRQIPKSRLLC